MLPGLTELGLPAQPCNDATRLGGSVLRAQLWHHAWETARLKHGQSSAPSACMAVPWASDLRGMGLLVCPVASPLVPFSA